MSTVVMSDMSMQTRKFYAASTLFYTIIVWVCVCVCVCVCRRCHASTLLKLYMLCHCWSMYMRLLKCLLLKFMSYQYAGIMC